MSEETKKVITKEDQEKALKALAKQQEKVTKGAKERHPLDVENSTERVAKIPTQPPRQFGIDAQKPPQTSRNIKDWEYKVVRSATGDWFSIQEVYIDENGVPNAQTIDLMVEGESIIELSSQLTEMKKALNSQPINEIPGQDKQDENFKEENDDFSSVERKINQLLNHLGVPHN